MIFFYIILFLTSTYAQIVEEAATITVPEPDTQICRSDEESSIFFIQRRGVLESYAFGFMPPFASSCKVCSTGSQFNYLAINSGIDVSLSDIEIIPGQVSSSIIGMFACDNSRDLCIQAVNEELYTAQSRDVVFYATAYCQGGFCDTVILLAPNSSIKRVSDGEVYSYEDQTMVIDSNRKYKDASEHNYLRARGFSCSTCSTPIPYCDKVDGRIESEATSHKGASKSESSKIQEDFPQPSKLTRIQESGYSSKIEVPPAILVVAPQADASTIDNYGMAA